MKKALVLGMACAVVVGIATFAAPLSGLWNTEICLTIQTDTVLIVSFETEVGIAYTVAGWDLEMITILDDTGLTDLYFTAYGEFGAFSFGAFTDFDTVVAQFGQLDVGAAIDVGGVTLYGIFSIEEFGTVQTPDIRSGWAIGTMGEVGDLRLAIEADFGLFNIPIQVMWFEGYDFAAFMASNETEGGSWIWPWIWLWRDDCSVCLDYLTAFFGFPFTCLDVTMGLLCSCDWGFGYFYFSIEEIDLGTWFMIEELEMWYIMEFKDVDLELGLVFADSTCFTPHFSLIQNSSNTIRGISFDAFTIDYTWDGVTFLAGTILNTGMYGFDVDGTLLDGEDWSAWLRWDDVIVDEFFGIVAKGDSCCGGLWSAGVYNFFLVGGSPKIFDWVMTTADLQYGLAANLSVTASLQFSVDGLDRFCVGFEFTW